MIAPKLLRWFRRHKRDLPWRTPPPRDPYRVWLAEVMLQQTQVATVIPYFERWTARFPSLAAFADAPLADVLKQWEGLGYYSRARNFHRAAQMVARELGGRIPDTVDELLKLPGVGPYTAAAIASLAFNCDAPLVDGNVKRVLGRVFAGDARLARDDSYWRIASSELPRNFARSRAGAFNEALMDLGATVCTPKAPRCHVCPLRNDCAAFASGAPENFPPKRARAASPHRDVVTALAHDTHGRVLLAQRKHSGLLGGLWELPSSDFGQDARTGSDEGYARAAERLVFDLTGKRARATGEIQLARHAFTHFKITRHVARVVVSARATRPAASHRSERLEPAQLLANQALGAIRGNAARYDAIGWFSRVEVARLALARSDRVILDRSERSERLD